jgi:hypothetical protein
MFVVANLTSLGVVCLLGLLLHSMIAPGVTGWPGDDELICFVIVGWGLLIHFLVVLAGSGIPTVFQLMSPDERWDYTLLQITNPFWSLNHISDGGLSEGYVLLLTVPTAAICILLLSMRSVIRELQQVRSALPARVVEDEAQLHPAPAPQPTNPWDEP